MLTTFPRRHLLAISHLAGKQDVRYYLCGVFVEVLATETRLVATDGHALGLTRHVADNEALFGVIIPNDIVAIVVKLKLDALVLENESGRWTIAGIPFTPVDGRFPDYRRVVPRNLSGAAASFNPEILMRFTKVAAALQHKGVPIIRQNGGDGALVHLYARDEFIGVAMPMRDFTEKSPDLGVPSWA